MKKMRHFVSQRDLLNDKLSDLTEVKARTNLRPH